MASPHQVSDLREWIELMEPLKELNCLKDIYLFLKAYEPQFLKRKDFSGTLLAITETLDLEDIIEEEILRELPLYKRLHRKALTNPPKRKGKIEETDPKKRKTTISSLLEDGIPPGWKIVKSNKRRHDCPCEHKCSLKVFFHFLKRIRYIFY